MAQPLMPVAMDESDFILERWDSASSTWIDVIIDASQLPIDVVIAPLGVLPALDGAALTNLPRPGPQNWGLSTLDSSGNALIAVDPSVTVIVCQFQDSAGVGPLNAQNGGGGSWTIASVAGGVDVGVDVGWVAF